MNCQEWTELMQRDLDGDLSVQEHEFLMDHMKHCPDCKDMHERLVRLSDELEHLPEVVPAYSLVDAILPRLEQISLGMESESALSEEPPVSAGKSGGSGLDGSDLHEANSLDFRIERNKWRRWTGGLVTAAAVVAVFIAVYNAPDINNGRLGQTAANQSAASEPLPVERSIASTSIQKKEVGDAAQKNTGEPELYSADASAPSKKAASDEPDSAASPEVGASDSGSGEMTGSEAPEADMDSTEPSSGSANDTGAYTEEDVQSSDSPDSADGAGEGNDTGAVAEDAVPYGIASSDTDTRMAQPDEDNSGTDAAVAMSLASPVIPGPIQAESNDGLYSAVAVGYTIKIFDQNSELLFETERKNGRISELTWSEDNTELTYVVELEQGGKEKYRIKVSGWQDEKASVEE